MIRWLSTILVGITTATVTAGDRIVVAMDFEEAAPRPGERLIEFPDLLFRPAGPETPGGAGQWGTMALSDAAARRGSWSLEAVPDGMSMHARSHRGSLPALPSTTYDLTAWISTEDLNGDGASLAIWCEDGAGTFIEGSRTSTPSVAGTASWTRVSARITTPESSPVHLAVAFQILPEAGAGGRGSMLGGTAWFDDVTISARPEITLTGPIDHVAGASVPVSIVATTVDPVPGERSLTMTLRNDHGETRQVTTGCDGAVTETAFDLGVLPRGWYAVTVAFHDDSGVLEEAKTTFLVTDPGSRGLVLDDRGDPTRTLHRRGGSAVALQWTSSPDASDAAALAQRAQRFAASGMTPIIDIEPTGDWKTDLTRIAAYLGGIPCRFRLLTASGEDHDAAVAILTSLLPECTVESPAGSGDWRTVSTPHHWRTSEAPVESVILEGDADSPDSIASWCQSAAIWRHAGGRTVQIQASSTVSPLHGIVRTLLAATEDATPAGELHLGEDIQCRLLACSNGTYTALLWTPSGTPRTVAIPFPAPETSGPPRTPAARESPSIIDAMGNPLSGTMHDGIIEVDISRRPIIVTGLDGPTMAFCRDLRFAQSTLAAKQTTHELSLEASNHFQAPLMFSARPHDGDGYTISPRPVMQNLPPSASGSTALVMRVIGPPQAGRRWIPMDISLHGPTNQRFIWMLPLEISLEDIDVAWTWHLREQDVVIDLSITNRRSDDVAFDLRVDADAMARQPSIHIAVERSGEDRRRIVVRHGASSLAGDVVRLVARARDGSGLVAGTLTIPTLPPSLASVEDSR